MQYRVQALLQTEDPENEIDAVTYAFAESLLCDSIEEAADEVSGQIQSGVIEAAPVPVIPGTCHMCGHTQREPEQ